MAKSCMIIGFRSSGSSLGLKCISLSSGGQLQSCQSIQLFTLALSVVSSMLSDNYNYNKQLHPALLMLPKRKIIKKRFTAPKENQVEQVLLPENIVELLQSEDAKSKSDAMAAIANLEQFSDEIICASTLIELINALYLPSSAFVHTTLFAINNVCLMVPDTVPKFFSFGLDKALTQLNSTDSNLIKPVLILMTTISSNLPSEHAYLVRGVQNTMFTTEHLQSDYYEIVLQFLMRSEFALPESPTLEQSQAVDALIKIAETDKSYKNRIVSSRVLIMAAKKHEGVKQIVTIFSNTFQEIICDINLENQYSNNFPQKQAEVEKEETSKTEMLQKNQEEEMVDEKEDLMGVDVCSGNAYKIFTDALEGVELALEYVVEFLQNQNNYQSSEGDESEDEEMVEEDAIQHEQMSQVNEYIMAVLLQSINENFKHFSKFTSLSFVQGQIVIELFLRLLMALPSTIINQGMVTSPNIILLAEATLISLFKNEIEFPHLIPVEYLVFNSNLALQIVLKHKSCNQRSIYVELPTLKRSNGEKIMKIEKMWKQTWISLLELYSVFFNPEKNAVSAEENEVIGKVLKDLILFIPEIELEEWRGQAIDTLFDIYSNEAFDRIFTQLNFLSMLSQILKSESGKGKKQKKKSTKFIKAILCDIERFICYKQKMIGA